MSRVRTAEIRYFPPGWADAHVLALEVAHGLVTCPNCKGAKIVGEVICWVCRGKGTVR